MGIGLLVTLFVSVQAFNGQLRPALPKTEEYETKGRVRTAWEISHRGFGLTIVALAWYQIESGIRLYQQFFVDSQDVHWSNILWGIVGTITGCIVAGYITIRVTACCSNQKTKMTKTNAKEDEENETSNNNNKNNNNKNNNNSDTTTAADVDTHTPTHPPEETNHNNDNNNNNNNTTTVDP